MNMTFSSRQLRRAADLKEQIDALESELSALLSGTPQPAADGRRHMSYEARARIAAAQRARWSRFRRNGQGRTVSKPRRRMSAAGRARIAAAARARWRKAKAAGRNAL